MSRFYTVYFCAEAQCSCGFRPFLFVQPYPLRRCVNIQKSSVKRRETAFEPSCLFFFRCLSIRIQGFMGIWRSLPQRGMWTLHIIEIHVFPDAFFEFFYGMIVPSIQFLAFERGEKGFHDCVITGFSRRRKGLLYMKCFEQLLKSKVCK